MKIFLLVNKTVLLSVLVCINFVKIALTESVTWDWANVVTADANNEKESTMKLYLMRKLVEMI